MDEGPSLLPKRALTAAAPSRIQHSVSSSDSSVPLASFNSVAALLLGSLPDQVTRSRSERLIGRSAVTCVWATKGRIWRLCCFEAGPRSSLEGGQSVQATKVSEAVHPIAGRQMHNQWTGCS